MTKTAENTTFLYFAYGSNMSTRRLAARTPSARADSIGYVEARRLVFDKVSNDGSGKADIEATGKMTDRVYGVLFRIDAGEERKLDIAEGLDKGYRKDTVQVVTETGTVPAKTYVATKKDPVCVPYHWYKAFVVAGAVEHGLPSSYIEWLRTVASTQNRTAARQMKQCCSNESSAF